MASNPHYPALIKFPQGHPGIHHTVWTVESREWWKSTILYCTIKRHTTLLVRPEYMLTLDAADSQANASFSFLVNLDVVLNCIQMHGHFMILV